MPPDADFDLTDPCSPPPRYNVLHDPHLKEYFQNPAMRKRLIEKGVFVIYCLLSMKQRYLKGFKMIPLLLYFSTRDF